MAELEVLERPLDEEEEQLEERPGKARRNRAKNYFQDHPRAKWVLLAVAIVVIAGGIYFWHYYSTRESTDDAQVQGHVTSVAARVSGTIIQVNVDDNQYVEAGTVLAQIDPRDYQVALEKAKAQLADAQANSQASSRSVPITATSTASQLANAQAGVAAAQQEAQAAQARVREAEANYKKLSTDEARLKQLVEKDEVSRQQYDAAVAAAQAAAATLDAAKAAVATAQSHVVQARSGVRAAETAPQQVAVTAARAGAAEASVGTNKANLDQAQLNLDYTTIKAPVSGIVSKKNIEAGQIVQAGQPLIAIVPLNDIWVIANFKETQLKDMKKGQTAKIHVDAYDRDYSGKVDSIGGATAGTFSLLPPENASGNFVKVVQRIPVKIVFDEGQDKEHLLRPGMSVVPTVYTK
jgi:membrane fusion protein (multidrug efflux system)